MKEQIADLFEGWEETLIWSCLQGVMGEVLVDDVENPKSALAKIGRCASFGFLAGQPTVSLIEVCRGEDIILVPEDEAWVKLIDEAYEDIAQPFTRYATKKDTVFDTERLEKLAANLPSDFALKPINENLYQQCLQEFWSQDLVANYKDVEEFLRLGLGYVIVYENQIVSGASSYSTYKDGIEIEVDTHPDFRRKGLAKAVAAQLILECLKQNRYPSWDAHTKNSLDLAKKLGYEFSHEYIAYEFEW
ncbi:GNAT family N-acetyltransferase [Streptococcus orisratti]|uniref:GNAT family N-acetyltransferase n=1 Tax=Streptococcus orisratti TaxID=114652 RepID=UPI00235280C5|nr:GNAT family N-acetyltransferase [Streptococcus orisratti]MCI7677804.1 GNAT family N-acetyltransferase [Streptococcus orisratti]